MHGAVKKYFSRMLQTKHDFSFNGPPCYPGFEYSSAQLHSNPHHFRIALCQLRKLVFFNKNKSPACEESKKFMVHEM